MPPTTPVHQAAVLVAHCLAALDQLGIGKVAELRTRPPTVPAPAEKPDAWLRFEGDWGRATYACEAKRHVTHATLGAVANQMRRLAAPNAQPLLLTEYVPPELGTELRKRQIEFVDTAGNAHLHAEGLRVWTLGHKPAVRRARRGHAFHLAGLRVLYQVLRAPKDTLALTQRELAARAGIALGGVGAILDDLQNQGWITTHADKREVFDLRRAQMRFEEGYAERLRERLQPLTCRQRPETTLPDLAALVRKNYRNGEVLLGGELGAAELTQQLRPEAATLHVRDVELRDVMRALDLLPDPEGNVTLLPALDLLKTETGNPRGIADPLLLRAEILLHPDDRLHEIAEVLQTRYVEPRWR